MRQIPAPYDASQMKNPAFFARRFRRVSVEKEIKMIKKKIQRRHQLLTFTKQNSQSGKG